MTHEYDYLIVGGGMTGDAAARGIREHDKQGSIAIVSGESSAPYARPPLSKDLWTDDEATPKSIDLHTARDTSASLHLDTRIERIDLEARQLVDVDGNTYGYGKLLLATGAKPKTVPVEGERVIYFRYLEDYKRLRRYAKKGAHVALVGSGFIGSEIAAALAQNGVKVTLIFPDDAIGAKPFLKDLADHVTGYFRKHGVDVRPETRFKSGVADADRVTLTLSDGETLEVAALVVGIGVEPEISLAKAAELEVDDGIVVDEHLRTSAPSVFAAGDCASFLDVTLGKRRRVEHEDNAVSMGHQAGANMAGANEAYTHLPYFYSDLFDLGYEAVGELNSELHTVEDWKKKFKEGVVYYLDDSRKVRGVLLWNVFDRKDAARKLIAQAGPHDDASLKGRITAA